MRFLFPLALALAACSSDPAPPVDSGPADTGPVHVDIGNGVDVIDVPAVPHDQGADSGAVDAGDAVAVGDAPAVDVVDAAGGDVGADAVAVGDAGSDVPADVRVSCAGDFTRRCTSSAQCQAMCLPYMDDHPWCCGLNGECAPYLLHPVCPPR